MAFRFRRSMKIAPGLTLNVGKKSASVRVGGRGAGFTTGTAGSRATVGAPGTGLSYTTKVGGKRKGKRSAPIAESQQTPQKLGFFGWLGVLVVVGGILWGMSALIS